MNEREEVVAQKYAEQGWKILRGGAPDFLMLRVADGVIVDVRAVEVKKPGRNLSYEQHIYRTILERAGIVFRVEVVE